MKNFNLYAEIKGIEPLPLCEDFISSEARQTNIRLISNFAEAVGFEPTRLLHQTIFKIVSATQ